MEKIFRCELCKKEFKNEKKCEEHEKECLKQENLIKRIRELEERIHDLETLLDFKKNPQPITIPPINVPPCPNPYPTVPSYPTPYPPGQPIWTVTDGTKDMIEPNNSKWMKGTE